MGSEFRVLDDEGNMLGVLTKEQALAKAKESQLDLVLLAASAKPPVLKIIDFNKHLYQLAKKSKNEKKGKTDTKELKIGLFMAEHDVERIKTKASQFLKAGNQVRLSLWLKGRELGKKDQAKAFLINFVNTIENSKMSAEPLMHGKVLRVIISYDKKKNEQTKN